MASLESNLQHTAKVEKTKQFEEPTVEAAPEIDTAQLESHAEESNNRIDQQSEAFASEGEQQLDSAANTMGISSEGLAQLRWEEGLDAELDSFNAEEAELANATKQEIADVVKEDSFTKPANDNEATAVAETETAPAEMSGNENEMTASFVVSDPLVRSISDGTYGKRKAERRPKSISEGGTKYVPKSFDSLGWEEASAPKQEKIQESKDELKVPEQIVEKPSEAPAETIDQPKQDAVEERPNLEQPAQPEQKEAIKDPRAELRELVSKFQETQPLQEPQPTIEENKDESKLEQEEVTAPHEVANLQEPVPEQPIEVEPKSVEKKVEAGARWYHGTKAEQATTLLQERFESKGIETEKIKIPGGGEFSEAVIFKKEAPTEKMVRLYRGVNQLNDSLLDQTPYAMRAQGKFSRAMTIEGMRDRVTALAEDPTYDNLMAYVAEAQPHLNRDEAKRMREDVTRMEDGILEGYSVRRELIQKQIEHAGGISEGGLTPYISASFNPAEAAGYGNGGVMVIDVPISQIEDFGEGSTEVNIKGSIGKEYITAILVRDRDKRVDGQDSGKGLENALASLSEADPMPLYDQEELTLERQKKFAEGVTWDTEQWQKDAERVRENRSQRLIRRFRDMNLDYAQLQANATEQGTDVYTATRNTIYDRFADRLSKLGREGRKPEELQYESKDGQTKTFTRENIDDEMLSKLEQTVEHLEELEERRRRIG